MKNLSKWAKANPVTARWLIAFSHILVVGNAIFLGILLFLSDWGESILLLPAAVILFSISYLLYPKKGIKKGLFRYSYVRQKMQDFSLVFSYGLVIALGVNNFFTPQETFPTARQATTQLMSMRTVPENEFTNTPEGFKFVKTQMRELKKQIRHELKDLKKDLKKRGDKKGTDVMKMLFILLTIGVAIFLGYLLAGLSCSIACSGNEGLAWVVLIGGGAGLILLTILAISSIMRDGIM